MIFEDTITIDVPVPEVWDFLLDVNRVAACAPGVQEVSQIDDRTFDAIIAASVGPIAGNFAFRACIVESSPPTDLTAKVEGTDSVTKSTLNADLAMTLAPAGDHGTHLAYRAAVDVHGRLAILGDMVLRATASVLLGEFMNQVRSQLEHSNDRGV